MPTSLYLAREVLERSSILLDPGDADAGALEDVRALVPKLFAHGHPPLTRELGGECCGHVHRRWPLGGVASRGAVAEALGAVLRQRERKDTKNVARDRVCSVSSDAPAG